ncbi:uncharacterized protein [Triticum aestivum]|uniref:uncharacterized protein n=1 Tax=Triticum aestivum TaxID=4565 RepID=UPI001D01D3AA|nr:uncharacterized protein LOC123094730 [Triticum aestivum]
MPMMEHCDFSQASHYERVLFGTHLLRLVQTLRLRVPKIAAWHHLEGKSYWNVNITIYGRSEMETMIFFNTHPTLEGVMSDAVHGIIARLCGRYHQELGGTFFRDLGWQDITGEPNRIKEDHKRRLNDMLNYNQDLESYIKGLQLEHFEALQKIEAMNEVRTLQEQKLGIMQEDLEKNKDEVQAQEIEIKKLQKELWEERARNKRLKLENRVLKGEEAEEDDFSVNSSDESDNTSLNSINLDVESRT